MAISKEHHSLGLFQEAAKQVQLFKSRWAFLGNQRLRGCPRDNPSPDLWREWWGLNYYLPDPPYKLAKSKLHGIGPWMDFFGADCVMWDYNGKDGAIQHDLNLPVEEKYFGTFDVVTNFGTSEHVVPSQMPCFQTMHDLCKPGGLMLHAVPSEGCNRHGDWRYPVQWMRVMAEDQGYEIISLDARPVAHNRGTGPHLYCVAMFRKMNADAWKFEWWTDPPKSER